MSSMDHLQPLIELALILILVSNSKGETWGVKVNRSFTVENNKIVTIPCTFSVPPQEYHENLQLFWKVPLKSTFNTYDRDVNAFIFHPNRTFVLEKYRGKTQLLPQGNSKSCTLRISDFMDNRLHIYLRVIGKTNNYTFYNNMVTISQSGQGVLIGKPANVLPSPTTALEGTAQPMISETLYLAIFVPIAVLLILVATAVGFVVWRKHTRSAPLVRECSGYYANFSRASSNQTTREENCKKSKNEKLPDMQVTEEPVYINMQHPTYQLDSSVDREGGHRDSVYANVDHSA
ncbi:uncharacterized protein LOC133660658 [Entelurus aequoreus]|uniref:uncharacterized protein LOC133660658 n=1 Tax=Entelurus aequoreus TaxID=161455 RepID=UPI002B1CF093|nr:uncharacterized protein LOC133660658 [Entelurus aequoreus]XP_061920216.1 uncharacterized protein LOC133660658 [Entelurus aequoreus]